MNGWKTWSNGPLDGWLISSWYSWVNSHFITFSLKNAQTFKSWSTNGSNGTITGRFCRRLHYLSCRCIRNASIWYRSQCRSSRPCFLIANAWSLKAYWPTWNGCWLVSLTSWFRALALRNRHLNSVIIWNVESSMRSSRHWSNPVSERKGSNWCF